jgi:hypothetical protein
MQVQLTDEQRRQARETLALMSRMLFENKKENRHRYVQAGEHGVCCACYERFDMPVGEDIMDQCLACLPVKRTIEHERG